MGDGIHCQVHVIGYPQVCVVHVRRLHAGDVLIPCARRSEGRRSISSSQPLFVTLVEGSWSRRIFGSIREIAVECLLPKLLGKAIVGGLGMHLLQELTKARDLSCLQCKPDGAADDTEELRHGYQGRAGPSLACQPDLASDVSPDNLFDERLQIWAAGKNNNHSCCGVLDDLYHLLDLLFVWVLGDELAKINADISLLRLFPKFFNPWPAIVIISCDCSHPVPAKVLDDVCHGCGLMLIVGDCAQEGLELVLIAQETTGWGIADLSEHSKQAKHTIKWNAWNKLPPFA